MPVFKRLQYALYMLIAVTMILMLALGVGEGLGLVQDMSAQELMFHPLYCLPVFAVGFALAPVLARRLPVSGDQHSPSSLETNAVFPARAGLLALVGLVLAMLAGLVVFLLGRFA